MTNTESGSLLNPDYLKKQLYRRVAGKAIKASISGAFVVGCFVPVTGIQIAIMAAVILCVFFLVLYGLGRITNSQVCRQFYTEDDSLERLIQQHLHLPLQKAVETFLLCFLAVAMSTGIFVLLFGLQGYALIISVVVWLFMSCISSASAYMACTRVSSIALEELVSLHGEETRKKILAYSKRKFIGVSLDVHYFFFVLVPIFLTFVTLLLLIVEDQLIPELALPVRLPLLGVFAMLMVTVNTVNFFRYVKDTGRGIESVVEQILQGEEYQTAVTESPSEIAYTARLVNTIHLKTTADRARMAQKLNELTTKQQSVIATLPQIDETLEEGLKTIDTELELLEKVAVQNTAISKRIKESRTVARKTGETVGESQRALQQNVQKMQEIAAATRTATAGILSLSNKISGIWEIVDLIDSIADQTTIIAFNAELEAEKIHQNRDKFKNVAYAIRNLTDQVLDLTGKIRSDIRKIQEASTVLLEQGKENTGYIDDGTAIAGKLSSTLKLMESSATDSADVSESVHDISENFSNQVTALREQLAKCREYLESYKAAIRTETDLAHKAGTVLGAEE